MPACFLCALALTFSPCMAAETAPFLLTDGFSHNDYEHTRPLFDALDRGFCAAEADIYLRDGKLLIGHDADKLRPDRTLTALYLDPLRARVEKNGGSVFPHGPEFLLLIDIKTEAESTYSALKQVLSHYRGMLTTFSSNSILTNAVTIILSGNRPIQAVRNDPRRLVAIDGRLIDLEANPSLSLMPLISDNWTKLFRWRGEGAMPQAEKVHLQQMVAQAHIQKRKLRLWAAPDRGEAWRVQQQLGVDLINTDKLEEFAQFHSK
jgi:hypothetical protein